MIRVPATVLFVPSYSRTLVREMNRALLQWLAWVCRACTIHVKQRFIYSYRCSTVTLTPHATSAASSPHLLQTPHRHPRHSQAHKSSGSRVNDTCCFRRAKDGDRGGGGAQSSHATPRSEPSQHDRRFYSDGLARIMPENNADAAPAPAPGLHG